MARIKQSEIKSEIGKLKENAPVNSGNGFLKYNFISGVLKNFSVNGGFVLIGKRNTLNQELELPGYFTLLAGIGYQYKRFSLSIIMNNMGNVVYWSGAYNNIYKWPGAGRNFMCKLSWDLPFSRAIKH
jgi:iron complex outermembrane receptor protein